jgi:hypothetical protein
MDYKKGGRERKLPAEAVQVVVQAVVGSVVLPGSLHASVVKCLEYHSPARF